MTVRNLVSQSLLIQHVDAGLELIASTHCVNIVIELLDAATLCKYRKSSFMAAKLHIILYIKERFLAKSENHAVICENEIPENYRTFAPWNLKTIR